MPGIRESMVSKRDVVPAPRELTDYGGNRKVPITKEFGVTIEDAPTLPEESYI